MSKTDPLEPGFYYHIFNRGIDGCDLFREPANYEYFFALYLKYIDPVADTYAWVMMKNHFHFLIRIKDLPGLRDLEGLSKPPSLHFSHWFNAYAKAYNKRFNRTGSLFEKNFHRKRIMEERYLKNVLLYIHNNPVHHGFCNYPDEYPWSSYLSCISVKPTCLQRDTVVGWFTDLGNFKFLHEQKIEIIEIENWLKI